MKRLSPFFIAWILLLAAPAFAVRFSLSLFKTSFSCGERVALRLKVLNDNGSTASNYTGWVKLRSTDPTLRIRGKNNDGSDIDLTGGGNILISGGTNRFAYVYSFAGGSGLSISAEEYMQNSAVPVEKDSVAFSIASSAGDILFNEIMFSPGANSIYSNYDYIELYNNSDSTVDLSNLSVYRYRSGSSGNTTNKQLVARIGRRTPVDPNNYFVVSRHRDRLLDLFTIRTDIFADSFTGKFDGSAELIVALDGAVQDAFEYSSSDAPDDVSLERQTFLAGSSWAPSLAQSEVLSSFYGTPGRPNSTVLPLELKSVGIKLLCDKKIISEGETAEIDFSSPAPGIAEVSLFDLAGRKIRDLFPQADIGRGIDYLVDFDGKNENGENLAVGPYVVSLRFINDMLGLADRKSIVIIVGWKR